MNLQIRIATATMSREIPEKDDSDEIITSIRMVKSPVFPNARKISPLPYASGIPGSRVIWHVYHRSKRRYWGKDIFSRYLFLEGETIHYLPPPSNPPKTKRRPPPRRIIRPKACKHLSSIFYFLTAVKFSLPLVTELRPAESG